MKNLTKKLTAGSLALGLATLGGYLFSQAKTPTQNQKETKPKRVAYAELGTKTPQTHTEEDQWFFVQKKEREEKEKKWKYNQGTKENQSK